MCSIPPCVPRMASASAHLRGAPLEVHSRLDRIGRGQCVCQGRGLGDQLWARHVRPSAPGVNSRPVQGAGRHTDREHAADSLKWLKRRASGTPPPRRVISSFSSWITRRGASCCGCWIVSARRCHGGQALVVPGERASPPAALVHGLVAGGYWLVQRAMAERRQPPPNATGEGEKGSTAQRGSASNELARRASRGGRDERSGKSQAPIKRRRACDLPDLSSLQSAAEGRRPANSSPLLPFSCCILAAAVVQTSSRLHPIE
jgi:hypothetical protein